MEKGSCSRNSNRREEVGGDLDSASHLNVSSDESNRNEEVVVNVEERRSSTRRQRLRYPNSCLRIMCDAEDDDHDDVDYECVINERGSNRRGSNSAQKRRTHGRRKSRSTLRARCSRESMIQETQERSVVSWLIDSGTVELDAIVCYVGRIDRPLFGKITRGGVLCYCCKTIVTISGFEAHSGVVTDLPLMNMFIGFRTSLFHCQLTAWRKVRESCKYNRPLKKYEGDSNDDTCGVCGDGGKLICCDACPSTFHQNCLGIKEVPLGKWYCPLCLCKYCELVGNRGGSLLLACRQCEQKYHPVCIEEEEKATGIFDHNGFSFCGKSCSQLFEFLQNLVGFKTPLGSEITWSLIRSFDFDLITSGDDSYKRTQYNATLAVALAVMEECFDPIIDRRTGINVIQNIVCNQGSHIHRLNFGGFYTAVLKRDDEILSVASIRIHGTSLAEMPFICTRNKYRCKGLCSRLLTALESTLAAYGVEKIIIPSISERVHKWINNYGFKHIEEPLRKQIRNINLLAFPGTVQLQKVLLRNTRVNESANRAAGGDVEVRLNDRPRAPLPFDLNEPYEEDESAKKEELQPYEEDESAKNEEHQPYEEDESAKKEELLRPTHGVFTVFNPEERRIRYQRVELRH